MSLAFEKPEEITRELNYLTHLQNSPGWAVFNNMLQSDLRQHFKEAVQSPDVHKQTKSLAAYAALEKVQTWLERRMSGLRESLLVDTRK